MLHIDVLASRTSPSLDLETLLLVVGFLIVYLCYKKLEARGIDRMMAGHLGDPPTIAALREKLAAFSETTTSQFTANRHANIEFRGKRISLLDVTIGCIASSARGTTWQIRREWWHSFRMTISHG